MTNQAQQGVSRFSDIASQAWANGGGLTRVLATGCWTGSVTDFDWRLSVADVGRSGPFSPLPGVDRILTVAEGPGLTLTVDGDALVADPFRPVSFSGDSDTWCRTGQPTRDFNVMTRRQTTTASISICEASGPLSSPTGGVAYVVPLLGQAVVRFADREVGLEQFDLVALPGPGDLVTSRGGRVAVVRIGPRNMVALNDVG